MSVTNYLTNAGRVLVAKMLASQRLVYTRATSTSDMVPHPELLEELPNERQTSNQLTVEQQSNYAAISCAFNCRNLEHSYQLSMVGIYAKIEGSSTDVLYMVTVYDPDDGPVTLPAGQDISYRFIIYDSVADGTLNITVADSAAAPYEHILNPYRHIFTQTNSDSNEAIVNSGDFNDFVDGQRILFVPATVLTSGHSVLVMGGKRFGLSAEDLAGYECQYIFLPHKSYVLRFLNGSFKYVKHDEIEVVDGVAHYWNGAKWNTVIPAGQIITSASKTAPPGTIPCKGQYVLRSDYPELFLAIGTECETTDENNFRLPDLDGRCLIGTGEDYELLSSGGESSVHLTTEQLPAHSHSGNVKISGGSHAHQVTITIDSHSHSLQDCVTKTGGSHSHPNSLWEYRSASDNHANKIDAEHDQSKWYLTSTTTSGSHSHELYGTTGKAGGTTVTAQTASKAPSLSASVTINNTGSNEAHNNMQPYTAVNYFIYTGRVLL